MFTKNIFTKLAFFALLVFLGQSASAADRTELSLVIREHRFIPERLEAPAKTPLLLKIKNEDATPEEFESHSLKREKVIQGGKEAVIRIGALEAGEYPFVGEFNEATAKGVLVIK